MWDGWIPISDALTLVLGRQSQYIYIWYIYISTFNSCQEILGKGTTHTLKSLNLWKIMSINEKRWNHLQNPSQTLYEAMQIHIDPHSICTCFDGIRWCSKNVGSPVVTIDFNTFPHGSSCTFWKVLCDWCHFLLGRLRTFPDSGHGSIGP